MGLRDAKAHTRESEHNEVITKSLRISVQQCALESSKCKWLIRFQVMESAHV